MAAGSCGAIQGANSAKITKTTTSTTPVAASGLWRAFRATLRRNEMAVVDTLACEFLLEINLLATVPGLGKWMRDRGTPLPPTLRKPCWARLSQKVSAKS